MKNNSKISNGEVKKGNIKTPLKTKAKKAKDLRGLFIDQLKDIYWTEKALIAESAKMIDKSTSKDLKDTIQDHLDETRRHVTRLEKVFTSLNSRPEAKKSEAISGLINEAEQIINETEQGAVRDAGIIFACQRIEHYEIATYGTLCSFAKILDETEAFALLEETLKEEKAGDERLSEIAESVINIEALYEHA